MTKIPVIGIRLFDPEQTPEALRDRLITHFVTLQAAKDPDLAGKPLHPAMLKSLKRDLGYTETEKIGRRVDRLVRARELSREDGHLKTGDRKALQALAGGAQLVSIPSEHRADEIAAELHADMPWMGPANELVWQAMRRSVREGWMGLRLPPMLLDGPPASARAIGHAG